jgi:hypothetical protein
MSAPCGSLDPATASQLVLTRIDDVLLPAAQALGMLDTSTTLTHLEPNSQTGSVTVASDTQTAVNNLADKLSTEWLLDSNVESADGGQVTYLLPSTVNTGVTQGGGTTCGSGDGDHPVRLRLSRIDCADGDNIELDVLVDSTETLALAFELTADRIQGALFLGDLISEWKQLTTTVCSGYAMVDGGLVTTTVTTDTTVFDPGATGVVAGEVDVTDGGLAHALWWVPEPVSIGWAAADGGPHYGVAVGSDEGTAEMNVDPNAGTIAGALGSGATTVTTTLADFVSAFFGGRSLVASANPSDPVTVTVPGLSGSFAYAAGSDQFAFDGVGWNGQPALAIHGTDTLIRVDVQPDAGGSFSLAATADVDSGVDVSFTPGYSMTIDYNLASVAAEVVDFQPFAASDLISIVLGGPSPPSIRLLRSSGSSGSDVGCSGTLFQVRSGQLDLTSSFAPSNSVHVGASQCLTQIACGESDGQDWLSAVSATACQ